MPVLVAFFEISLAKPPSGIDDRCNVFHMFGRPTHGVQEHSSPEAQYYRWPMDCKHAGLTVEERLDENEEKIYNKDIEMVLQISK